MVTHASGSSDIFSVAALEGTTKTHIDGDELPTTWKDKDLMLPPPNINAA